MMRTPSRRGITGLALAVATLVVCVVGLPVGSGTGEDVQPEPMGAPLPEHLRRPWGQLEAAEAHLAAGRPYDALKLLGPLARAELPAGSAPANGWWQWRARWLQARAQGRLAEAGAGPLEPALEAARRALKLSVGGRELAASRRLLAALLAQSPVPAHQRERVDMLLELGGSSELLYRGDQRDEVLAALARAFAPAGGATGSGGRWDATTRRQALAYGRLLYRFGQWKTGVAHFSRPEWAPDDRDRTLELARGLAAVGRRDRAVELLQAALKQAGDAGTAVGRDALSDALATHLHGMGRHGEATALDLRIYREGSAAYAARALERLVETMANGGPDGEAVYKQLASLSAGSIAPAGRSGSDRHAMLEAGRRLVEMAGERLRAQSAYRRALWTLFMAAHAEPGRPAMADWALERLAAVSGGTPDVPRLLYWRSRRGDVEARRRLLHGYPLDYYAWLVREESAAEGRPGLPPDAVADEVSPPRPAGGDGDGDPTTLPAFQAARELARWGRLEAAAGELRRLARQKPEPAVLESLIDVLTRQGEWREALQYATWMGSPRLTRLYPRPYAELVGEQAQRHRLPEALVYAVMRRESSFEPLAYSPAGARGLMQLMPSTARWVQQQLAVPHDDPEAPEAADLYEPRDNVYLGTAYLGWLWKRYGDVRLVAAAYHAGQGRLDRWLEQVPGSVMAGPDGRPTPSKLAGFLDALPIASTRQYVRHIYADFRIYEALYADSPRRVSQAPPVRTLPEPDRAGSTRPRWPPRPGIPAAR